MKSENLFRVFPRLLVCVVALTAYCLCPQQASAADRVLCFGDSVTEGTYIDGRWNRGTSWVNVVDQLGADQIEAIIDKVVSDTSVTEVTLNAGETRVPVVSCVCSKLGFTIEFSEVAGHAGVA
ncbi:hypothetical protein LCGC14_2996140, partial [marine sediment metagenome]